MSLTKLCIVYLYALALVAFFPLPAFSHTTTCPPAPPCPDQYQIENQVTPRTGGELFQLETMGFEDNDYSFDKRLSPGLSPWSSAAAATLYYDRMPIRQYRTGDYVPFRFATGQVSITNKQIGLVTSLVDYNHTPCAIISNLGPPETAHPYLSAANSVRIVRDVTNQGCNAGYARYAYTQLTITPVTFTPTCSDGVWNGDETGIDCGGSCGPCEVPADPTTAQGLAGVLVGFALLLAVVTAIG